MRLSKQNWTPFFASQKSMRARAQCIVDTSVFSEQQIRRRYFLKVIDVVIRAFLTRRHDDDARMMMMMTSRALLLLLQTRARKRTG